MIKNIIIEGSDNCGKTTLINNYRNKSKCVVKHFGAPLSKNSNEQRVEQMSVAYSEVNYYESLAPILQYDTTVINDRSIFGELVYSKYRGYTPNYFSGIVKKLRSIENLQTLFVLIYFDKSSIEKFSVILKDDTNENYAKADKYEEISCSFIREIYKLNYGKVLVINSNNFNSFAERNTYIYKHIDAFINGSSYKFHKTDSYIDTPYNVNQNIFNDKFLECQYKCPEFTTCELGTQHTSHSIFGSKYGRPTSAYGSMNPKYIFVGEAPGYKGCGRLGIPFYNDVSGSLFQQALYNLNISPFDVYVTNTIKCCPQDNNLRQYSILNKRLDLYCVQELYDELAYVFDNMKSKTIYAIGRVAYDTLLALPQFKGFNVILTYHPAYFVRTGDGYKYAKYLGDKLCITK